MGRSLVTFASILPIRRPGSAAPSHRIGMPALAVPVTFGAVARTVASVALNTSTEPIPAAGRPGNERAGPGAVVGGAIGFLSAAVALGIGHLTAGFVGGTASPVIAVGSTAIDASPEWLKSYAIRTFGTNDKAVLVAGIGVVVAIVAVVVGVIALHRPRVGVVALIALGAVGAAAAVARPENGLGAAVPSIVATVAGLVTFRWLRRVAGIGASATGAADPAGVAPSSFDRRRFLFAGAGAAGLAAVSGLAGRFLIRRAEANASRAAVRIPAPADVAPPPPAGADLRIPGLGPFITPNDVFYRVDTSLLVPSVTAEGWSLRIHGMVRDELSLDYAALLARPLMERDVTLTCVSNPVGGRYIGNARWIGAPLADLLREAGVDPGADQIVSRSIDGFTVGTPTSVVMDGRDAMLAVAMNGQPLPLEHGFPVRMIVPGLYGYVSATKWLVDIELTTFASYDAYWVRRGWAQQAPIKTESRIDLPKPGATVPAGPATVAGIAWAQHRGISRVEVSVDGAWQPARLAAQDTIDTWRQWVYDWDATPGQHTLAVRATDRTGATQTATPADPVPNGATGDHTISVTVTG
jgi:DMSO/TMAO reductase YedYZ molybdopterin-dependent catalytic subunit